MSGFVIRRNEDGRYVRPAGRETSYTTDVAKARVFPTRESAEKEKCGNERIVPLSEVFDALSDR